MIKIRINGETQKFETSNEVEEAFGEDWYNRLNWENTDLCSECTSSECIPHEEFDDCIKCGLYKEGYEMNYMEEG